MKDRYIDQYGIDSLKNLKEAAIIGERDNEPVVFITTNQDMLDDKKELQEKYGVEIISMKDFMEKDKNE